MAEVGPRQRVNRSPSHLVHRKCLLFFFFFFTFFTVFSLSLSFLLRPQHQRFIIVDTGILCPWLFLLATFFSFFCYKNGSGSIRRLPSFTGFHWFPISRTAWEVIFGFLFTHMLWNGFESLLFFLIQKLLSSWAIIDYVDLPSFFLSLCVWVRGRPSFCWKTGTVPLSSAIVFIIFLSRPIPEF